MHDALVGVPCFRRPAPVRSQDGEGGESLPPAAPTGLAPVEWGFLHKRRLARTDAPTGLAPVERRLGHKGCFSALPLWCKNRCSTGASPVGACAAASRSASGLRWRGGRDGGEVANSPLTESEAVLPQGLRVIERVRHLGILAWRTRFPRRHTPPPPITIVIQSGIRGESGTSAGRPASSGTRPAAEPPPR